MFEGTLPHNGTPTSIAAAVQGVSKAQIDRERVFTFIAGKGEQGATCDEAEEALGLIHQTCSARFNDLHSKERTIVDAGKRRTTRSGRAATVYVVAAKS